MINKLCKYCVKKCKEEIEYSDCPASADIRFKENLKGLLKSYPKAKTVLNAVKILHGKSKW